MHLRANAVHPSSATGLPGDKLIVLSYASLGPDELKAFAPRLVFLGANNQIIDLAHNLGLTVVAEGVETEAQLEQLSELGCGISQGFALASPQPAEDIQALYRVSEEKAKTTKPAETTLA